MIRKVAQYKVKKVEVRAVEQAIIEFVAAITQNEPHTFYEAYQCPPFFLWQSQNNQLL